MPEKIIHQFTNKLNYRNAASSPCTYLIIIGNMKDHKVWKTIIHKIMHVSERLKGFIIHDITNL